ncbi:MAG: glycoside hydrolase family 3 C-terminal domain-containing protein [Verrucomicrobiota bacterium]
MSTMPAKEIMNETPKAILAYRGGDNEPGGAEMGRRTPRTQFLSIRRIKPRHAHRMARGLLGRAVMGAILLSSALPALAQGPNPAQEKTPKHPWMDKSLSPDRRAALVIEQMTLDEKVNLVHGLDVWRGNPPPPAQWLGGAGFAPGIPRLGILDIQMTDGRSGVGRGAGRGRYATALPSALALAASWDLKLARDFGTLLGKECRDLGFQVSLGGTANLVRDPRNGRNFECFGEDPILIGKMIAQELKATQNQGVVGNINRYALNDQETGRMGYNVVMDKRTMRETDLLAFEIAIKESEVGTVMGAYSRVNGEFACENGYLLNELLKKTWGFKGWVMSDWGATHSTVQSVLAGFDQEMPGDQFLGAALKAAVQKEEVPLARLDDMAHRILRTEFALGVLDEAGVLRPVNPFTGAVVAQRIAEASLVLLKNADGLLPLKIAAVSSIAVIGSHADAGVLSGGGSDQVDPAGGNAVPDGRALWHPSAPLKAIRAKAPNVKVEYDPGADVAAAARLASASEVAIVFVHQHATEGRDVSNLSLPDNQDQLIAQVVAANRRTIVVLETGGPVTMPWIGGAAAAIEAWYPGIRGGEAIANVLFGDVNPSAKLPVTFAQTEADLPEVQLPGPPAEPGAGGAAGRERPQLRFDIRYAEGLKVGYKWFDAEAKQPLFTFGFGLSYTTYAYTDLRTTTGKNVQVSFKVTNTGQVAGEEVAQVYVALPDNAGEPPKRLVAWEKVPLRPGETKTVNLTIDPLGLSVFNADKDRWEILPGNYRIFVGGSSRSTPLQETVRIEEGQ